MHFSLRFWLVGRLVIYDWYKAVTAIGREIRYVEYKLRRQQQEKKKKKQNRDAFQTGFGEITATHSDKPKFDNEVKASELTFNDEPKEEGKFDSDRPTNKQDEDRQLEVIIYCSNLC